MTTEREAKRASYQDVPATCPTVDAVLATLAQRYDICPSDLARASHEIKRCTTRLRDALIRAHTARLASHEAPGER